MFTSCLEKQKQVEALFASCKSKEEIYMKIMELGRKLPPMDQKSPEHLVQGCQSTTYLQSRSEGGKIHFSASSDALISAGLAALLILAYDGETPEAILTCPPDFLDRLDISASLTPNRANGLYSMHLRMKQDALKFLV